MRKILIIISTVIVIVLTSIIIVNTGNYKYNLKGELFLHRYGKSPHILSINTESDKSKIFTYYDINGYNISVTENIETIYYNKPEYYKKYTINNSDLRWCDCIYKYDEKNRNSTLVYKAENIRFYKERNNYLYILKGTDLISYELTTSTEKIILENVDDFDIGQNFLAYNDTEGNIYIYDIINHNKQKIRINYTNNLFIKKIRISQNDNYLAFDDGSKIYILDLTNYSESYIEPNGYNSWFFSPDGEFIAFCEYQPYLSLKVSNPMRIEVWNIKDNKEFTLMENLQNITLEDWM
ncbi:MAG: hypothetical protein IJ583_08290 [Firmicutes bacterium]|nr:hypothetical protein [Bacillota bacterium]